MEASRSRRAAGSASKSYDTTLQARWTQTEVTGTYTTPRCTYSMTLPRG